MNRDYFRRSISSSSLPCKTSVCISLMDQRETNSLDIGRAYRFANHLVTTTKWHELPVVELKVEQPKRCRFQFHFDRGC